MKSLLLSYKSDKVSVAKTKRTVSDLTSCLCFFGYLCGPLDNLQIFSEVSV